MVNMKKIVLHVFVVGVFFSCITSRTKKSWVNVMSIEKSMYEFDLQAVVEQQHGDSITLNSIAQKINFIHLQSGCSSCLTALNLILDRVEDKLIVSSLGSPVMQFDSAGNYEKKLVDIGRAKNEIQGRLYQWTFQNNQVTLCQGNKMVACNLLTGKIQGFFSKQYYYNAILLRDGNYVALPNLGPEMKEDRDLDFLDAGNEIVKSVSYMSSRNIYYQIPDSYTGRLETYGLYPSYTGDVLFKDLFNDTIYKIKDMDTIMPYICLKRGDLTPSPRDVTDEPANKGFIFIKNVAESVSYVFVNYSFQESMFSVVFEKSTGSPLIITEIGFKNATSIVNSRYFIDYVTPIGKKIKVGIVNVLGDRVYCVVRTEDALDFMPQMSEYDNPLILEVILK